ncbi:hypothetical protein N7532_011841 [Penicillium argentinense]|uniref:Alkyl sulfatase dimerisation domain-containing protein n=1 Tax=Penicillium argentinense TaxID=1131581 RepID=A0A9W9JV79_9EURO|nr:uncharacterized protein N7532_011841 [Penicillium argentinense]KAJ5082798.1 hypothetical protein N7532_011841 [Penicillium argentinense]
MYNIITLRGALAWSRHLDKNIALYEDRPADLFVGHHWPTWGKGNIARMLVEQRDMYAFMHGQTERLMDERKTGIKIAEMLQLLPALDSAWHLQGDYGLISHNIKAIYQRYMT